LQAGTRGDCSRIESRGFLSCELNEQACRRRQVLSYKTWNPQFPRKSTKAEEISTSY
jgi:hypothetical protein